MNSYSEMMLNKILDAPVGQVITVLGEILNCAIQLQVVEQNMITPNQFVRKVVITAQELPVITAIVKFDATILPKFIIDEILLKKRGIGTILNMNSINVTRKILSLNRHSNESIASREYELIHDGVTWFTILEEIRLSDFDSNKYG